MPALTVVGGLDSPDVDQLASAHEPCLFDDRYVYESQDPKDRLVTAHYPSYPFSSIAVPGDERVFLEGVVYNRSSATLRDEIEANLVDGVDREDLATWLGGLDGEFVIYVVDEAQERVTVAPDRLGQLPLWYGERDGLGLLGRNPSVLARLLELSEVDRLAAAQYLRLGYTLSDRTLYRGLERVRPGTIATVDLTSGSVTCEQYHPWNLEHVSADDRSLETTARDLAEQFTAACSRRASAAPGDVVVLLSGGLDSRSVMGGFERAQVPYVTATRDFKHDSRADIEIAEQLAAAVDAPWTRIETPAPTGADLAAHLEMAGGVDPFDIAHIQPFLRRVRAEFSEPWAFTGDGGDKLLPELPPPRSMETPEALVSTVLDSEGRFSADDVTAITGVTEDELRTSIRDRVEDYPEKTSRRRFLHYQLFERGFAWLFPATDTDRNHCWTTTPFYAPGFLAAALAVPDAKKRNFRLYREFLRELSLGLAKVPNANVGVAPTSRSHWFRYAVHRQLRRFPWMLDRLMPVVRRVLGTSRDAEVSGRVGEILTKQVANDTSAIQTEPLARLVDSGFKGCSRRNVLLLTTLRSVVERVEGEVLLNECEEAEFE